MTAEQHFESLGGQLLIAMPGLLDPNFAGSLSLICEHGEDGTIGFVINQPTHFELATVLEQIGLTVHTDVPPQPVLSGGPVAIERGFVVHKPSDRTWASSMSVTDEIQITTSEDIIGALAEGTAPDGATLILGYAGWSGGQLEREILDNSWLTLPSSTDVVFETDIDQRLKLATARAGIDFSRMSTSAGHA